MRVKQANALYEATQEIVMTALELGIRVSIENPKNSLFWLTSPIQTLLQHHPGVFSYFHNCMMGSDRNKITAWWCADSFFNSFNVECSKDHPHKSWAPTIVGNSLQFPTHGEAEYPPLLCQRVAFLIQSDLHSRGIHLAMSFEEQLQQPSTTAVHSVFMGLLPRGHKLRPLVSEFSHYQRFVVFPHDTGATQLAALPKGSRLVNRKLATWGEIRAFDSFEEFSLGDGISDDLRDDHVSGCH